jgi:hypothetical protein
LQAENDRQSQEWKPSQTWLVTYGPGEIYWQRFGHNAIWIRDQTRRLDHVFNFGFFDFEQENFFLRFVQGRMLYFSAASPAQREFSQYVSEGRSIRAQQLNLTPSQVERLTGYLLNETQPENRDYLYDYYANNCSTRVRDALDFALDGWLKGELTGQSAHQSLRHHTRRSTSMAPFFHLGLEIGLGSKIDKPVTRWDEMFLPSELADAMADALFERDSIVQPLVLEDVILSGSELTPPDKVPAPVWFRYLAASLAILGLVMAMAWRLNSRLCSHAISLWLSVSGLIGVLLLYFWLFTDHDAASLNLNLLLFNPAWLLIAFGRLRYLRVSATILLLSSLAALLAFWPLQLQYTLSPIMVAVPLHVATALTLLRSSVKKRKQDVESELVLGA